MAAPSTGSTSIDTIELETLLGEGGFGQVYLGRMTTAGGLKRRVAVKLLKPEAMGDGAARFRDEARLLAALSHPVILTVFELMDLDGHHALITEYVPGADLQELLATRGPLPAGIALQLIAEVAGGLSSAHHALDPASGRPLQLVHRDIKPGNIRLSRDGRVKLLDFGLALSPHLEREARTRADLVPGSLGYMAPERFQTWPPGPRSDVYALGCVLLEILLGDNPWRSLSPAQYLGVALDQRTHDRHLDAAMDRAAEVSGPRVRALLKRLLSHDEARRPDASEVESTCDSLARSLGGPSLRTWARSLEFSEPVRGRGPLAGGAITTLDGLQRPSERDLAGATSTRRARLRSTVPWLVTLLGVSLMGVVALAAFFAAGGLAWWASLPNQPDAAPPIAAAPPTPISSATQPAPSKATAEEPLADTESAAPETKPETRPAASPRPVVAPTRAAAPPEPEPEPQVEVEPEVEEPQKAPERTPILGWLELKADRQLELKITSNNMDYAPIQPGRHQLAAGYYDIQATAPSGATATQRVHVDAKHLQRVRCWAVLAVACKQE